MTVKQRLFHALSWRAPQSSEEALRERALLLGIEPALDMHPRTPLLQNHGLLTELTRRWEAKRRYRINFSLGVQC